MQAISEIAERTARDHIHSKVPRQKISNLEIAVEAAGSKPVTITIDVDLALSQVIKDCDAEKLANEATQKAFEAVEQYLEELKCRSKE